MSNSFFENFSSQIQIRDNKKIEIFSILTFIKRFNKSTIINFYQNICVHELMFKKFFKIFSSKFLWLKLSYFRCNRLKIFLKLKMFQFFCSSRIKFFYQISTIITILTFNMRITYDNISKTLYYRFHLKFSFDSMLFKIDR